MISHRFLRAEAKGAGLLMVWRWWAMRGATAAPSAPDRSVHLMASWWRVSAQFAGER